MPGEDVVKTKERWIERAVREAVEWDTGTKVLVAVEGFGEPGRECRAGEMLWPMQWCGKYCTCGDGFRGVTTDGNSSVGRVQLLRGVPRVLAETAIAVAMERDDGIERPRIAAAALLDEVADIEEDRLVRREEGILLPFPMAARIDGPHHITYRLTDEP